MGLATNSFELGRARPPGAPPPGQSRTESLIESTANIAIGISIAFISQELIFPFYGIHVSTRANLAIVAWFTAISLARSFLLRRLFNWITVKPREATD